MDRRTWRWAVVGVSVAAGAVALAILLILLLPAPTSAPTPSPTPTTTPVLTATPVSPPTATPTPEPGEVLLQIPSHAYPCADISATVAIGDVASLQYGGLKLAYDPAVLEVTGVSDGKVGGIVVPAAGNWELTGAGAGGQGELRFSVDLVGHEEGVDGSGSLCVIRFSVPCGASTGEDTPITFNDNELYDYSSDPLPLTWTDGLFTVRQTPTPRPTATPTPSATPTPTPTPEAGEVLIQVPSHAYPCADISATVAIGDVAGLQYGEFDVTYDPEILEVTGVSDGMVGGVTVPAVDNWELTGSGEDGQGELRFSVDLVGHEEGVDGQGSLCVIRFHVPCAAALDEYTPLSFNDNELYDYSSAPIPLTWTGDLFTVRQTPTPTPTATPTSSPSATPSPTPMATPSPSPTATATLVPDVQVWTAFGRRIEGKLVHFPGVGTTFEAEEGSDFIVLINISHVYRLKVAQYDITYDPSVVEVDKVSGGWPDLRPGKIGGVKFDVDNYSFVPQKTQGRVRVIHNIDGLEGKTGAGYLSRVYFHAVGTPGATSPIRIDIETLGDYALAPMSSGVTNASVLVVPTP